MLQWDWFEEHEEDDLSDAQRVFLAALRERARSWPCKPEDTQIVEPGDGCDQWRAVLDISAQIEKLILITIGVCFDGASIRVGEVHSQSFCPNPANRSRVKVFEATGSPEHLAQVAANWFEHVLARPVEQRDWERHSQVNTTVRLLACTATATACARDSSMDGPGVESAVAHQRSSGLRRQCQQVRRLAD